MTEKRGHLFSIFCVTFIKAASTTRMTTQNMNLTPTTKEPKIYHAQAATSVFNLKLCHTYYVKSLERNLFVHTDAKKEQRALDKTRRGRPH